MNTRDRAGPDSLVDRIRRHATTRPAQAAVVFLRNGESEAHRLTYAELDACALRAAAELRRRALNGQRVLLALPSGIDYVVSLLGCLYAGVAAVPAYPAASGTQSERLQHIVEDSRAAAILVPAGEGAVGATQAAQCERLAVESGCISFSLAALLEVPVGDEAFQPPGAGSLALLQYTSGSTGKPRGVMVSHGNIASHCNQLHEAWSGEPGDVSVLWLPLFHDMGIAGLLYALFSGGTAVLMPPFAFLQKPMRWLRTISRYRARFTFAPNFAYEHCVTSGEDAAGLDLSSLQSAGNGAEPIRADTLERFTARFAAHGFRHEAHSPGYGLAEATASVTTRSRMEPIRVVRADARELALGRFVSAAGSHDGRPIVACGRPRAGTVIRVVDPQSRMERVPGEIGEIWVDGGAVACGYWNASDETRQIFGGYTREGDGPFLRTGDLGVLHEGELYVTGRIKDLIIVRGRNHAPHDIEHTATQAHPGLEQHHAAAFAVEVAGEESVVVVLEVRRNARARLDAEAAVEAIRRAVVEEHGIQLQAVVLLPPGAVPLTTSGKIQRQACRADHLAGRFQPIYAWTRDPVAEVAVRFSGQTAVLPQERQSCEAICRWLQEEIARRKGLAVDQVPIDQPFASLGLDSLEAVAISGGLATLLDTAVDPTVVFDRPTIRLLAAHLAKRRDPASPEPTTEPRVADEPVAIVGMACRFPGAESIGAFWRLLNAGADAIREVPPERWAVDAYYQAGSPTPGRMNSRCGGFIEGADRFDAAFFGIAPREAECLDPQQRLLLGVAWNALEDAGLPQERLAGSNTGVFIGIGNGDYRQLHTRDGADSDAYLGTGTSFSVAANRISYLLDLRGPSLAIDTACSSSLVALHQARVSLLARECDAALAGGVNLMLAPETTVALSQAGMLSPDGRCSTFDAGANGYVRGEGCGVVVLKRLADAQRDDDRILAVLSGSAVNQDGRSNGLTAPNGPAQEAVIRRALTTAGIEPLQVGCVEAHGTGTRLGDPIEINALKAVYSATATHATPLWVGSVKTNIGHLEAAAGIAGVIKTVLSIQHCTVFPHLHLHELNPLISFDGTRLRVPVERQPWTAPFGERLHAGVSSFGFGGTNAHVVLSQAPFAANATQVPDGCHLLTLSAKGVGELRQLVRSYADLLVNDDQLALASICYTTNVRRSHHAYRLAVSARTRAQVGSAMQAFLAGAASGDVLAGDAVAPPRGKVAFLCTGQGAQYMGMGQALYRGHAAYRDALDRCEAAYLRLSGRSLLACLAGEEGDLDQTEHAQPALYAVGIGLAAVWRAAGMRPDMVVGHSLGEFVAACVADVFSIEDGLALVTHRGRLMQELCDSGAMFAVRGPAADVAQARADFEAAAPTRCAISAINGPDDITLSGEEHALEPWLERWRGRGLSLHRLRVNRAFHSPLIAPMVAEFERCARDITYALPRMPVVSNVTGRVAGPEIATPAYWVNHLLAPVEFAAGAQTLLDAACGVFVEIGPHPTLRVFGEQMAPSALWLHSLRRGRDDAAELLAQIGHWYVRGGAVDWVAHWREQAGDGHRVPRPVYLPLYPFREQRYWFKAGTAPARFPVGNAHPLLGRRIELADGAGDRIHFESSLSARQPAWLDQHRVFGTPLLSASAMVECLRAAACEAGPHACGSWQFENLSFLEAVALHDTPATLQFVVDRVDTGLRVRCFVREPEHGAWKEHFRADARAVEEATAPSAAAPVPSEAGWLERPLAGFYDGLRAQGLDYGPAFQGLRQLWRRADEALGRIECQAADDEHYQLHPTALDACLHALAAFDMPIVPGHVVLPLGLRKLRIHAKLPYAVWCHARWNGAEAANRYEADITLSDDAGRVVAELEGLQLVPLPRAALQKPAEPTVGRYEIEWAALDVDPRAAPSDAEGHWLVVAHSAEQAAGWRSEFDALGQSAITIHPAAAFERVASWAFALPIDLPSMARMFDTLRDEGVLLGGLVFDARSTQDDCLPAKAVDSTYSLARTAWTAVSAFLRRFAAARPRVLAFTRGGAPVQATADMAQSSLTGLTKAVIAEYPGVQCVQIDVDFHATDASLRTTLVAAEALGGSGQLALRDGQWICAQLQQRPLRGAQNAAFVVRHDGTYLLSGGLGGIGLALAEWLVAQGARSLVLLARTRLRDSEPALHRIAAAGARVDILQADVSDEAAVLRAVAHVAQGMAPLVGVMHLAGTVDDAPLEQLDWPRIAAVMDSKVRGAWYLHRATEHLALDCFVLFSSAASLIGSAGQGGYVMANAFLDQLAHHRQGRGLQALSINWGPWAELGMAARGGVLNRLAASGVQGLGTLEALDALSAVLASTTAQVGLVRINLARLAASVRGATPHRLLQPLLDRVPCNEDSADPDAGAGAAGEDFLRRAAGLPVGEAKSLIADSLFAFVQHVARLDAGLLVDLRPAFGGVRLNELGIDSLMAVELRNRIRTELGADVPIQSFIGGSTATDIVNLVYRYVMLHRLSEPVDNEFNADEVEEVVL